VFANFNVDGTGKFGAISTCSHCIDSSTTDSSARTYFVKNLHFIDTDKRIKFGYPYKEIIYSEDDSLIDSAKGWVVYNFKYFDSSDWDLNINNYDGYVWNRTIEVRRLVIYNPSPFLKLSGQQIKIFNMNRIPADSSSTEFTSASTFDPTSWNSLGQTSISEINTKDSESYTKQREMLDHYDQIVILKEQVREKAEQYEITYDPNLISMMFIYYLIAN
jgi:hypothetical protein